MKKDISERKFLKQMKKFLRTLDDRKTYDDRKVGEKIVRHGLCVSTCLTSDCGYETAILDANGTHPVERYKTKEEARKGHIAWGERLKTLTKVNKLRVLPQIEESEVVLERVTGWTEEDDV